MSIRSCIVLRAARISAFHSRRLPPARAGLFTSSVCRAESDEEESVDNREATFDDDGRYDEDRDSGGSSAVLDGTPSESGEGSQVISLTYRAWMEQIGQHFEHATEPKWLNDDSPGANQGPFPLNRSFRPPPPLPDWQRDVIYDKYMIDPLKNTVRVLAQQFHLSVGRVEAILRLKGMERDWKKGRELQTGFREGMNFLLRVPPTTNRVHIQQNRSDEIEEMPGRQEARDRYERHYWESVSEGNEEPVLSTALERAQTIAERNAGRRSIKPGDPRFAPRVPIPSYILKPNPIQRIARVGRPDLKFIDVGNKFIDPVALTNRWRASERKAKRKTG